MKKNYLRNQTEAGTFQKERNDESVLFDTVAVYLAYADKHLVMEKLGIKIDGFSEYKIFDSIFFRQWLHENRNLCKKYCKLCDRMEKFISIFANISRETVS